MKKHPLFLASFMTSRRLLGEERQPHRHPRLASVAGYKTHCISNNVDYSFWSGDDWRVIDGMRLYLRLHALCHEALRLGHDHSVVFANQKPARNIFPERAPDSDSDAVNRDRPLHGAEYSTILCGGVLRERRRECSVREPNQPVTVRRKFWGLGIGLAAIEDVCDILSLVGSER